MNENVHIAGVEQELVPSVLSFVEAHYAEGIGLRDVAAALAYSPAHLTYVFRRHTGKPITAWIIERRIIAAKKMLGATDMLVSAVADEVGFGDASYFTRQFRQRLGISPSRYRAEVRTAPLTPARS